MISRIFRRRESGFLLIRRCHFHLCYILAYFQFSDIESAHKHFQYLWSKDRGKLKLWEDSFWLASENNAEINREVSGLCRLAFLPCKSSAGQESATQRRFLLLNSLVRSLLPALMAPSRQWEALMPVGTDAWHLGEMIIKWTQLLECLAVTIKVGQLYRVKSRLTGLETNKCSHDLKQCSVT